MIDRLQRFPNQNIEKRFDECVGETVADIWGNIQNAPQDAGFSYAAALRVANRKPTTAGSDPYSGMLSAVIYGTLPTEKEPFDATTTSELYESNWDNYAPDLKHLASLFPARGMTSLPLYEDISNYLYTEKQGVMLAMTWFESFLTPNQDGTLPVPSGGISKHCVAVYGEDERGLQMKPWLGPSYGAGGYCYLPEVMFPQVFVEAYAFNLEAWRWFQLAYAAVSRPWLINDILPQLKS